VLVLRPFTSVDWLVALIGVGFLVVGVREIAAAIIAEREARPARWLAGALGALALVLGALVFVWPGVSVVLLVILLAILLVAAGVRDLVLAARRSQPQRWTSALFGLAGIILAVTMLAWPDVSVMVIGLLFGLWLIAMG